MNRFTRLVGLALLAGVLAAGCGKGGGGIAPAPTPSAGGGTISLTGAGASFPYPLYSRWISEYHQAKPQVQISYQSIGSGGGIRSLQNRTMDFGASDAPLSDQEEKAMQAPVLHLPMVAGAVAVAYNLPGVTRPVKLDGPALAGIFLGTVTRWNDPKLTALNSGEKLPDLPIGVVHRSDGSGTSYLFTSYLKAVSPEWASKVGAGKSVNWPVGIGAKGNEGVAGVVKQTAGGLGYVELAYAQQNKLSMADLRSAAGKFISPSVASTTAAAAGAADKMKQEVRSSLINSPAADAYPIAGFTYLLVYQDQTDRTKGEALAQFLQWAITDGQKFAEPLGYAPLPAAAADLDHQFLRRMTSQGKPLLGE